MIRTCLLLTAALGLAACGKDRPNEANQAFSDDDFTQSAIVANDVTAIDAATGDAANMAADLPADAILDNGDDMDANVSTGRSETRTQRPTRSAPERRAADPATPAPAAVGPSPEPVPASGNSVG